MKLTVVKIGGNVIDSTTRLDGFLDDFARLEGAKMLVHGGGKVATELASRLGVATEMIDGRRVTSSEMLDVAVMVYAGLINKKIVAGLQARGCNAVGLSGADGMAVKAHKRPATTVDYGFVGDVYDVNASLLTALLEAGMVPVFCAISCDSSGQLLNTNADTIAAAVTSAAASIAPATLVYCFEKPGVLRDVSDENSVIKTITPEDFDKYRAEGVIARGMLPKIENSLRSVRNGVEKVIIKSSADLLNENTGTVICL